MQKNQTIAVIGAGPMGLAAAYQLAKDGHRPVVFEADDRVGGMTASFDFGGMQIERYYHFICTTDVATLQMLDELNLNSKLKWVSTKMAYFFDNQLYSWGNPIALLKFPHLDWVSKFRYVLHMLYSIKNKRWKHLDRMQGTTWLKKWIGPKAYRVLWEKILTYKFHQYIDEPSAAWIWCRIHRVGNSRYNSFREKTGYLEGGSETLIQAMKESIVRMGGEIRLSLPVQEILIRDGKVCGVKVNEQECVFDRVISTIPIPYLPKILNQYPQKYLEMYRAIQNIAVVCVVLKLKKQVTENFWVNIHDDCMDIPGLVEYSNLNPSGNTIIYAPFYLPFDHPKFKDSDQVFIDKVKRYVQKINSSITESDILEAHAGRYRYAQPICTTGFLEKLPPVSGVVEGLSIADTSYYYPQDRGISESIEFGRKMARGQV
ncbi:MAG: NAD(P)/FAD-dependent oxidoreductase [Bdellovibrionota bacterium]